MSRGNPRPIHAVCPTCGEPLTRKTSAAIADCEDCVEQGRAKG